MNKLHNTVWNTKCKINDCTCHCYCQLISQTQRKISEILFRTHYDEMLDFLRRKLERLISHQDIVSHKRLLATNLIHSSYACITCWNLLFVLIPRCVLHEMQRPPCQLTQNTIFEDLPIWSTTHLSEYSICQSQKIQYLLSADQLHWRAFCWW